MPYITQEQRRFLDAHPKSTDLQPGDFTYVVYRAALDVGKNYYELERAVNAALHRFLPKTPRYADYAIVVGCLHCAAYEYERKVPAAEGNPLHQVVHNLRECADIFYLQQVAPYEDAKIEQNGDVT